MKSTEQFKALHGCSVSRTEVEQIVDLAKKENNVEVVYRLSKVLRNNPDIELFNPIEIAEYPKTGLTGVQHSGDYKLALDDCGRLRPGYKFEAGKVVKVQPKVKNKTTGPKQKSDPVKPKTTVAAKVKKTSAVQPKSTINLDDYLFGEKHPLLILDQNSSQFKAALKDFEAETIKFGNEKTGYWILKSSIKPEKETTSKETKYPFSKDDIPLEVGRRAYYWTSFTPDKRAEQEQTYYFENLKSIYDKYFVAAEKQNKVEIFVTLFAKFKQKYLELKLAELSSRSNTASTMITGGSNFNVRRNEKAQRAHENKYKALADFEEKYIKIFDKIFFPQEQPIKTGKDGSLDKLKEKLVQLQNSHEKMVKANAEIRKLSKGNKPADQVIAEYKLYLSDQGYTTEQIKNITSLAERENRLFWLPFHTTNSNAEIRRIKQRIAVEEKLQSKQTDDKIKDEYSFDGGTVKLDYSDNRVKIYFDLIPDAELRSKLKQSGYAFKWSPFNKAWQRQLNTFSIKRLELILPGFVVNESKAQPVELPAKSEPVTTKSEPNKYDFIFEVSHGGGYVVKSFIDLPISKSVKDKKVSDSIDGLYSYNATSKGLEELKKSFPNNAYGDKHTLSSKDLNKPLSLFGAKKKTALKQSAEIKSASTFSSNSRVMKIGESSSTEAEFFTVNGEVGKFLQRVEKKPKESVVITIDGEQGAGKTTMLYQFMDSFASAGNKSLFISGEEHPESELARQKTKKHISSKAVEYLDVIGKVNDVQELYHLVADYDVIFIDSWQKLQRMIGVIRLDEDLRQKFDGKVFVIIFQQTTTGRTKGGAEVVFDGDIVIKMYKSKESFSKNYASFDKNRYTLIPIENIRYNIATGKTYNPNTPAETEVKPTEKIEFSFNIK